MNTTMSPNMTGLGVEVVSAGRTWATDTPRGVIADAIEEKGRHEEAALLRGPTPVERIVITAGRYYGQPHRFSEPDVGDLAAEYERLYPDMVNEEESGNGQQTAGYSGCRDAGEDDDGEALVSVGWYDCGGNIGERVLCIRESDVPAAYAVIRALSADANCTAALYAAGIEERRAV